MSKQMDGNPYAEQSAIQPHLTENDGFWGISQTIMALAYEQRTANLIAFSDVLMKSGLGPETLDDAAQRLGLDVHE